MFSQEEIVVYPSQGVGRIDAITHRDIDGKQYQFYVVRILLNDMTLMVPIDNAALIGLRALVSPEHAGSVLKSFNVDEVANIHIGQNWNRRYRGYAEKLKSPELQDVASVLKELLLISRNKELSFGEKRLMEQAMVLVTSELSAVLQVPAANLQQQISEVFQQTSKVEQCVTN